MWKCARSQVMSYVMLHCHLACINVGIHSTSKMKYRLGYVTACQSWYTLSDPAPWAALVCINLRIINPCYYYDYFTSMTRWTINPSYSFGHVSEQHSREKQPSLLIILLCLINQNDSHSHTHIIHRKMHGELVFHSTGFILVWIQRMPADTIKLFLQCLYALPLRKHTYDTTSGNCTSFITDIKPTALFAIQMVTSTISRCRLLREVRSILYGWLYWWFGTE